jgi:hypothetical protein
LFAKEGEEYTAPPVVQFHTLAPETALIQYTLPSVLPTYTRPSTTAGEDHTAPFVEQFHTLAPVAAFRQYTLPSVLPTYTYPPATAGEEYSSTPVV